jgi:hypothetical protein
MGVQPIDAAALTRGPFVAYVHQGFLVQMALSGIRHNSSGSAPAKLHTLEPFHHDLRVRAYVVGHGHNAYKI